MKIVFITETWRPHIDGVITRLEATVAELRARGHDVVVIAPTRGADIAGVRQEVIRHALIPIIDRSRPWGLPDRRITALVEAFDPDIVHLVSPVLMGAVAARRLSGRYPVVASFHTDIAAYAGRYGLALLRPVLSRLVRRTYQNADLRLATSPTGRRRLADVGVDAASVLLWPPAVADTFAAGSTERTQGRPPETTLPARRAAQISVVSVGRLAREKGCDRLAPAAGLEPPTDPGWRLTFIGDGPDRGRLQRLFAGTPVHFAGALHGPALVEAYRRADVIVFTSTTDTVGLVLLEAMALRRPIVAVDTPASRDALADYPRAVFLPVDSPPEHWGQAFARAAAIPALCDLSATSWRPPLSWSQATDRLLLAYDRAEVTAGRRPRGRSPQQDRAAAWAERTPDRLLS